MTQFALPITARQGSVTPLSVADLCLDVEVLADRYEAFLKLEDELHEDELMEETDGTEEVDGEALDDPPF